MPTPMSISRSYGKSGFDSGFSWGRDSSLSRMLERNNSVSDAFDHPTPTSFSHLALLSSSATSDTGDRLSKLEENFCQGYHCCGLELADLHRLLEHFEEHHALSSSPATSVINTNKQDSFSMLMGSPRALQLADMKRRALNESNHQNRSGSSKSQRSPSVSNTSASASGAPSTPGGSANRDVAIPSDGSFHMDDVEMELDAPDTSSSTSTQLDLPSTSAFSKGLSALSRPKQNGFGQRRSASPSSTSSPDISAPSTPVMDSDMDDGASDWDASASTTSLTDMMPSVDCVTPSMLYPTPMGQFQSPAGSQRTSPEAEDEAEDDTDAEEEAAAVAAAAAAAAGSDEPRIVMGSDPTMKHLNHRGRTLIAPPPTLPSGRPWVAPAAKPFKCPVPGCDKAYKQQNGLKYHRLHGNCNNRLGGSGRPDASGDETDGRETLEEKPYGCYVGAACGKRYKNMNGLRYHYQHSGPHGQIGLEMLSKGTHPSPLVPPGKSRGGSASAASSRANSPAPLSRFGHSLNLSSRPASPQPESAPGTPLGGAAPTTAQSTGFPGLPLALTGH